MKKDRLLTGLQPSGVLTIGNYCGGINQVIRYQQQFDTYLFVPDLHAITVTQDSELLKKRIKEVVGLYLAAGVDPECCHIYVQSENLYHANLSWILECNSYFGEMSRMHQFKEKSKKNESFTCGLFTYPVLMAADILLYDAKFVPTGADQKQHVELARNIAERFNRKYDGNYFVVPNPLIPKVGAKIRDLVNPTKKMDKSTLNPNASIFLTDTEKDIRKKISKATTDSEAVIRFDEDEKPGLSNLITIYSVFTNQPIEKIVETFSGAGYGELKKSVADVIVQELIKIQDRYTRFMNEGIVDDVLDAGRDFTINIAAEKYETIRQLVGLGR